MIETGQCLMCGSANTQPEWHQTSFQVGRKHPVGFLVAYCHRCGYEWIIEGLRHAGQEE